MALAIILVAGVEALHLHDNGQIARGEVAAFRQRPATDRPNLAVPG
jgi:hypothetical protein